MSNRQHTPYRSGTKPRRRHQSPSAQDGYDFPPITLEFILQKLWVGLQKLWVALRYQLHRVAPSLSGRFRLPWFKLSLIVIALFFLAKKDIQFTINMKAPLAGLTSSSSILGNQLGLVRTVSQQATVSDLPQVDALNEAQVRAYVGRFSKVAQAEMERFGLPASIKMAQGILESWAGDHPETMSSNNHFGAHFSGQHFNSAWENWRAHTLFLRNQHPDLFTQPMTYQQWANALQKAGYSTDQHYAEKLLLVIDKYGLERVY